MSAFEYNLAEMPESVADPSLADELSGSVDFDVMAFGGQATVCSALPKQQRRSSAYQSEAQLEDAFVKQLCRQGYKRLAVSSEEELIANLRTQLEALNRFSFSDKEWARLFKGWIAADNDGIVEKTRRIQRDHVYALRMDDGSVRNVSLIDKRSAQ